jgi:hypothetical protein
MIDGNRDAARTPGVGQFAEERHGQGVAVGGGEDFKLTPWRFTSLMAIHDVE